MERRNYDLVEALLSSRKRTLLRRSLGELRQRITKRPAAYMKKYGINKVTTVKSHVTDIDGLLVDLNLE